MVVLAISVSAAGVSSGALIQTDPNGLAFHARLTTASNGYYELQNDGTTEIGSVIYSPPNPGFAGSVLWAAGAQVGVDVVDNDTVTTDGVTFYAEYTVQFNTEGTYRVWWAGQRTAGVGTGEGGTTGNNDSIWIGGTNVNHLSTAGWTSHTVAGGGISYRDTAVDWVIDALNVNTDLTFTVGLREDGPVFDRIAFVRTGSGVTAASLEVVPEPSSIVLAIAAVGLVAIGMRHRR
jgi:hypothetical protein